MKRWILAVVTLVSLAAGIGTSFAQGFGYGGGYYGQGHNSGWGSQPRSGGGHYDYHPGAFQRHGLHFDYVPGHYDYHQGNHRSNFFGR